MKLSFRATLAGVALCIGANSAHAALFDDDEARRRIEATSQRLSVLQRQVEDRLALLEQQRGVADLANQIQLLQGDIAKVRGQLEVITYELEQSQKRQRDLYVDLDSRLRKLETAPVAAAPPAEPNDGGPAGSLPTAPPAAGPGPVAIPTAPPSPSAPPAVPPGSRNSTDGVAEQRAYDNALESFKRGDYLGAIAGFGTFVRTYPRSSLVSSAQYWLGNAQYARRDYRASINTQRQLLKDFPDSGKAPDALLNIASAQADMGDNAAARRSLEELIARYPRSEPATRARQRLGVR